MITAAEEVATAKTKVQSARPEKRDQTREDLDNGKTSEFSRILLFPFFLPIFLLLLETEGRDKTKIQRTHLIMSPFFRHCNLLRTVLFSFPRDFLSSTSMLMKKVMLMASKLNENIILIKNNGRHQHRQ